MILSLLAALQFALPQDTLALKTVAFEFDVPVPVLYAVKWKETRVGRAEMVRGPGREQCDSLGCRRVCREIGPLQVNPCIRWNHPACATLRVYISNLRCGAAILRSHYNASGSWARAIERYNGSGPRARMYAKEALAYLGWFYLLTL